MPASNDERGASMVEAAIVGPIVFFLIFLVFQGAMFARSYLAAGDASEQAARAGAIANKDPLADYDTLSTVNRSLSSVGRGDIRKIVIFRAAQSNNFDVPTGCNTKAISGWCNFYTGTDLGHSQSEFGSGGSLAKDLSWPAPSRYTDPTDKLGVYVELRTGGIGGPLSQVISRSFVVDPEPR